MLAKLSPYLEYKFFSESASHVHRHLLPHVFALAGSLEGKRVLDVGCGNGFVCGQLYERGCYVVGIDLSESGIALARTSYKNVRFELLAADEQILDRLNEAPFDLVVSTEVVEHLYNPRAYIQSCFTALKPGGRFICSTPYHGYLKNLLISICGYWDRHANPLWDCGHIKLWSRRTLSMLLREAGFINLQFRGAGRLPYLWMTMVMAGDKPL